MAVYRIQEFARLAGVTVRALRHYDRLGLLKPTARSEAGYRLYRESDLPRLQHIAVLKFVGLPLTRIGEVLRREVSAQDALARQRDMLHGKRARLTVGMAAIDRIGGAFARGEQPDWTELASLVHELERQSDPETWWQTHLLKEARKKIWARSQTWKPTLQDYELTRDIKGAITRGDTPATPGGQALVARWKDAIVRFVNDDPEIREALKLVMADRTNWPASDWPISAQYREYFDSAMKSA